MDAQIGQMSEEEREEIVRYGIKRGKVIFISTLITIFLGWVLGVFWQSIIFWFCLSILRKYAGGYHADTEKQCYLISFIMVFTSLLCIKLITYSTFWGIALQTICLLIIFFLAPVENMNHILDEDEKRKYGMRTKIISILFCSGYVILLFQNKQNVMRALVIANVVVSVSLVMGYIKNKRLYKKRS